jgi:hypothetical protein
MSIANRSTNVRAKPIEHDQPNRGGACEDGWNAASQVLTAESKNLCLQNGAGLETISHVEK